MKKQNNSLTTIEWENIMGGKKTLLSVIAGLIFYVFNVPMAGAVLLGPYAGSWTGSEDTQLGRIFRDAIPSDGTGSKTYPGTFGAGTEYGYQVLETFLNDGPQDVVTIDATVSSVDTHFLAYLFEYDPTNLANNYLGDIGSSVSQAFSILAPADSLFSIVVQTSFGLANATGETFSYTISGDNIRQADVPEPTTLALFGLGLAGLGFARKKKNSA